MNRLVIVESPNKVRKIQGFLGSGYKVAASIGHVRDLPPGGDLGVTITDSTVSPHYEVMRDKATTVKSLKAAAKHADEIILATDPDREGEAIAWHLAAIIGKHTYRRVTFNAITADAVRLAMTKPRSIDLALVNAQQSRRVLDRVVGWLVSPTCAKGTGDAQAKSAGRVQSVALRVVAERETDITNFKSHDFYGLMAQVECPGKPPIFRAKLLSIDGKDIGNTIHHKNYIESVSDALKQASWSVSNYTANKTRRLPPPPFVTSTIQQAASITLKWRPDHTMKILQSLFEGGHITYHRTDSTSLSPEGIALARDYIAQHYDPSYLPDKPVVHSGKVANAQEAHEAIRPTHPETGGAALGARDDGALYQLIWERFISSQMTTGTDVVTVIDIRADRALFRARSVAVDFLGWRTVSADTTTELPDREQHADSDESIALPVLDIGDHIIVHDCQITASATKPPPRYTQASLIKTLEGLGVGRPSTYAAIMAKLLDAGYMSDRQRKLHCSEIGLRLIHFLKSAYQNNFIEIDYTRRLEAQLDAVARGDQPWEPLIASTSQALLVLAQAAGLDHNPLLPAAHDEQSVPCPACGKPMRLRSGARGSFYGCTGYPRCKHTAPAT